MNPRLLPLLLGALLAPALPAQHADTALAHPLTLGDAIRLASRLNAQAQEARERAAAASARVTQRRSEILPEFDATALESGRTLNAQTFGFPGLDSAFLLGPVNSLDLRLHAVVPLVNIASYKRISASKADAAASSADAASIGETAGQVGAAAYVRVQRAEALVTARLADSVLADSLLDIARDQLRSGVGVAIDVTRAQVQLSTVRAQLIAQRAERDRSRLEFLRALDLPLDTRFALADSLDRLEPSKETPAESASVALALTTRPDIRAAQMQLEASQTAVSSIKAERIPSLGAAGDWGSSGVNGSTALNTFTWGIQLSLPIFDGLRREGRIEEEEAGVRESRTRLNALVQQASIEVRAAIVDLVAAREFLGAARERLELSQLEVQQARERFVAGVAGNLDVITASSNLNTSRSQLVEALASYQDARVSLARAEGTVTSLP